jgi:hypothetical protein
MSRRSSSANTARTCVIAAPCGVVVSTATSSATRPHPARSARNRRPVASWTLRESRSSLLTMSTVPWPASRSASSGRLSSALPLTPSSLYTASSDRPRRAQSASIATRCAANPVVCFHLQVSDVPASRSSTVMASAPNTTFSATTVPSIRARNTADAFKRPASISPSTPRSIAASCSAATARRPPQPRRGQGHAWLQAPIWRRHAELFSTRWLAFAREVRRCQPDPAKQLPRQGPNRTVAETHTPASLLADSGQN